MGRPAEEIRADARFWTRDDFRLGAELEELKSLNLDFAIEATG
jgi:hypothetical protein